MSEHSGQSVDTRDHPHPTPGKYSLEEYLSVYGPGDRHTVRWIAIIYGVSEDEVSQVIKEVDNQTRHRSSSRVDTIRANCKQVVKPQETGKNLLTGGFGA